MKVHRFQSLSAPLERLVDKSVSHKEFQWIVCSGMKEMGDGWNGSYLIAHMQQHALFEHLLSSRQK